MFIIKRSIIKKRKRIKFSVSICLLVATGIIALSFYISMNSFVVPQGVVYICSAVSVPDGLKILADDIINKLFGNFFSENSDFSQNDSDLYDIEEKRQFYDLSVTPSDIAENEELMKKQYNDEGFKSDGTVIEKTYTTYQATDWYDNVYIRNVTVDSDIDAEGIITNGCSLPIDDPSEPVVLIYHTHSTESYIPLDNGTFSSAYPGRNDNKALNMIRVGEELSAVLKARGIGVIHDTTIYDSVYTGAYDKSRKGIAAILQNYPSIVITIDVHRDAIYYDDLTRVKPVTEVGGVKAAQMMIIAGAEGGNVENFKSWQTNLSFALNLQNAVNTEYENLMKPVYFCNRKYNMDITPYSLLVEVGTDVNTLSEAAYSARLLGDVLASYIKSNSGGQ